MLYVYPTQEGDILSTDTLAEKIYMVIGAVVAEMLKPGESLHVYDIIAGLHRLKATSAEQGTIDACQEAVKILSRRLH